jgi:hypothetical protein
MYVEQFEDHDTDTENSGFLLGWSSRIAEFSAQGGRPSADDHAAAAVHDAVDEAGHFNFYEEFGPSG